MANDQPIADNIGPYGLDDVSMPIMRYQLVQMLRHADETDASEQFWNTLSARYPNYRDFISVLSYQIAPEDTDLRSEVVSALLQLFFLIDKSLTTKQLQAMFQTTPVKKPKSATVTKPVP